MNSVMTKDNFVATEITQINTSQLRQVFLRYDKVFNNKPTQGRTALTTKKILSDIAVRIQIQEQHNLCRNKDYSIATKKHEGSKFLITTRS